MLDSKRLSAPGSAPTRGADTSRIAEKLKWKLNRLRCMTPAEVLHRCGRAVRIRAEHWGLAGDVSVPPPDLRYVLRPWIAPVARVDPAPYLAAAERILAGKLDVFALRGVDLGTPPRWNRDPKTGREPPLTFGKLLDYRDASLVGDIKYLWEVNRHLHLVTLAQAYALTGSPRYTEAIRAHVRSWIEACPYGRGANWSSALEPAMRLINWAVAWQLIGGAGAPLFADAAGEQFRREWLDSIYRHAAFVRGHFSRHSSANNHLIGEAAGLFVAAVTWRYWRDADRWLTAAQSILEDEALRQNAPDGVNREQAVSYQQFEFDLLLLARLAGGANGAPFSRAFDGRLEAMLEYLASIMDRGGNVPMIGDSDDGFVVRLAQGAGFCRYRSLLATGSILFDRSDFKAKAGELDDKTRWLLGPEADERFAHIAPARTGLPVRQAFPEGGYYVLGCAFEQSDELRLVADAGPLGYEAIAAHGHADALSFTLSAGGMEFLIDPGTFAYHTQAEWRNYFRGTSAHNTLRIDGRDQSQPGGNFMWLRKANAHCDLWSSTPERDVLEAWHDGYAHLADPVVHRRRITVEKRVRRIVIEDTLVMSGTHDVELFFHCSEQCAVERSARGFMLRRPGVSVAISLPAAPGADARLHRGSTAPILGWVSRSFDEKQPAPTIAWRATLKGRQTLRTEIFCGCAAGC